MSIIDQNKIDIARKEMGVSKDELYFMNSYIEQASLMGQPQVDWLNIAPLINKNSHVSLETAGEFFETSEHQKTPVYKKVDDLLNNNFTSLQNNKVAQSNIKDTASSAMKNNLSQNNINYDNQANHNTLEKSSPVKGSIREVLRLTNNENEKLKSDLNKNPDFDSHNITLKNDTYTVNRNNTPNNYENNYKVSDGINNINLNQNKNESSFYSNSGYDNLNSNTQSIPIDGKREKGGPVQSGKNYLVGEKGPEILQMGSGSGNIVANDKLGGSPQFTVNFANVNISTASQVNEDFESKIRNALDELADSEFRANAGIIKDN